MQQAWFVGCEHGWATLLPVSAGDKVALRSSADCKISNVRICVGAATSSGILLCWQCKGAALALKVVSYGGFLLCTAWTAAVVQAALFIGATGRQHVPSNSALHCIQASCAAGVRLGSAWPTLAAWCSKCRLYLVCLVFGHLTAALAMVLSLGVKPPCDIDCNLTARPDGGTSCTWLSILQDVVLVFYP